MKTIIALICAGTFAITATAALAQQPETRDVTEYTFNDEIVPGTLLRPDNSIVTARTTGKTKSLIRVRKHFIPHMLKSVEDI